MNLFMKKAFSGGEDFEDAKESCQQLKVLAYSPDNWRLCEKSSIGENALFKFKFNELLIFRSDTR